MEEFVTLLSSKEGDVYHITLSEDTVLFSKETIRLLGNHLSVITAKGIDDTYFFHLIYREEHAPLAPIISKDIKEGYSK